MNTFSSTQNYIGSDTIRPERNFKIIFLILVPLNAIVMGATFAHYFLDGFIWTENFLKWFGAPKNLNYTYSSHIQTVLTIHGCTAVLWQAVCHTMIGLMLFGKGDKARKLHVWMGRRIAPVVLLIFVVSALITMFLRPVEEGLLATVLTFGSAYAQAILFYFGIKCIRAGNIEGHKKLMGMMFLFSFTGGLFIRSVYLASTLLAEAVGGLGILQMHSLHPDNVSIADNLVVACRIYTTLIVFAFAYLIQGYSKMLRNNILITAAVLLALSNQVYLSLII